MIKNVIKLCYIIYIDLILMNCLAYNYLGFSNFTSFSKNKLYELNLYFNFSKILFKYNIRKIIKEFQIFTHLSI